MKILVFGASGGCGRSVVEQGLERGHEVTTVTRAGSTWSPPKEARHRVGDVRDPEFLQTTLADQEIVISCLGLRRASPAPWSRLLSPPDLVQTFTAGLRDRLEDSSVKRVIWISAGGVGDSAGQLSAAVKTLTHTANVGVAYADLEAAEKMTGDDDRWLAVRPVTLINGRPTGRGGPVDRYGLLSTIRRSDVARWIVDVADGTRPWTRDTILLGTT